MMWRFQELEFPFYNGAKSHNGTQSDASSSLDCVHVCCNEDSTDLSNASPNRPATNQATSKRTFEMKSVKGIWTTEEDLIIYKNLFNCQQKYNMDVIKLVFDKSPEAIQWKAHIRLGQQIGQGVNRSRGAVYKRIKHLLSHLKKSSETNEKGSGSMPSKQHSLGVLQEPRQLRCCRK